MANPRGKFRCTTETAYRATAEAALQRTYSFMAQTAPNIPDDQRLASATPSGTVTITVDNPSVSFEPGSCYYVVFIPAD